MRCERVDVWRDCDEVRVLDEEHGDCDEVRVLDEGMMMCERVDVWRDCDEVRVLDEGMDEVNVSEWMYGGIVMR